MTLQTRTPAQTLAAPFAIGIITPSANVVAEKVAIDLMRAFPHVSVHFSRTPVFGDIDPFPEGYDGEAMLGAARLLAHAEPRVLVWAGSKGVGIGIERDRDLCTRIVAATGIPTTTSSLALCELVERTKLRRVAVITPYGGRYQRQLIDGFHRLGIDCIAEAHSGLSNNLSYSYVTPDEIRKMVADVLRTTGADKPDAVLAWCTNFWAAPLAAEIEGETGIPFYDSMSLVLWRALRMLDIDTSPARAWGRVFIS